MAMLTTLSPEDLIPADHPIRRIGRVLDAVLADLDDEFTAMYAATGRPSVPPEQLLKATVLMAMYSIRSERAFCERLNYDLLFKWFLDLPIDAKAFDASTFSKNRQRLLDHEIADRFFALVVAQAKLRRYVSSEHFSVDGTLLEAWASQKSFRRRDTRPEPPDDPGNPSVNFRGEARKNDTHQSTTDPDARLYRKSRSSAFQLSYLGHVLVENRSGLSVGARVSEATPQGEWEMAVEMLQQVKAPSRRVTVGADRAYDEATFIDRLRALQVTPHVHKRENERRSSNLDGRTTRHPGYSMSLRKRKCVEHIFGWLKNTALAGRLRHRGLALAEWMFTLAVSAYNLVRMRRLIPDVAS
jgi:transposase